MYPHPTVDLPANRKGKTMTLKADTGAAHQKYRLCPRGWSLRWIRNPPKEMQICARMRSFTD